MGLGAERVMATPKLKARGKGIASKQPKSPGFETSKKPYVEILKCIGFQKFRYCGENRPGKKYQEKDFLQLALGNMSGKNVKVQIVCFDPDKPGDIHPNGLVGRDCIDGIYMKTYPISKPVHIIRIPYLRTERILTKKKGPESSNGGIKEVLQARAKLLPHPYGERCLEQCHRNTKYDTTRVCFGVIITFEDGTLPEPLCVISNVVQNASEKTTLKILKLSTGFVSAQEGGEVDIFTSEDGPPLTAGKCTVRVLTDHWTSEPFKPLQDEIMYKRVVTYRIPSYKINPYIDSQVPAVLQLSCIQSGQTCECSFMYEAGPDTSRRSATLNSGTLPRKRAFDDSYENQALNEADIIKLNLKAKVQCRQAHDEPVYDLHKRARTQEPLSNGNIPVVVSQALSQPSQAAAKDKMTLDEEGIIWAKDVITGEVVYLRADAASAAEDTAENIVVYVHDGQLEVPSNSSLTSMSLASTSMSGPKAVAVPVSEWSSMSLSSGGSSTLRTLEPARHARIPSIERRVTRSASKVISPWIVDDDNDSTPLINGDIAMSSAPTRPSEILLSTASAASTTLKQEVVEMGPPVLSRDIIYAGDSGAELTSITSLGNIFDANLAELKYDNTGTLDSVSVFEMVTPFLPKN